MNCNDFDRENTTAGAMNHVEETKIEEVTQNLPPHALRPGEIGPSGKNPGVAPIHNAVGRQLKKPSEATARRANQLSGFLEQGDLMEIALNPSREEERLALKTYLGYVHQLLEGMVDDDGPAGNGPPLPASNGRPDHKTSPKPESEV